MKYVIGEMTRIKPVEIETPSDAARVFMFLTKSDREVFCALHLTPGFTSVGYDTCGAGTMKSVSIESKHIFRNAILEESTKYLIVVHSHPYQKIPLPSEEDYEVAKSLIYGGSVLAIPILDSIVIGSSGYFSFMLNGRIWPKSERYKDALTEIASKGIFNKKKMKIYQKKVLKLFPKKWTFR